MAKDMKDLYAAAAAHIIGNQTGVSVKGSPEKVRIVKEVIRASKELYEGLEAELPMVKISKLLESKRACAERFQATFNEPWVL